MRITHIAFSGAGCSGLSYLGVIRYLQMEGLDLDIVSVAGSSMGALFACAFALGIPAGTLELDVKEFLCDPTSVFFPASKLMNIFSEFGMDDATIATKVLEKYFESLWGRTDVTFLDFAKTTGKDLVVSASCVETGQAAFFSVNATPNVEVLKAIRASMSVPLVFRPVIIDDKHYIDAGVTENHPVDCFGEKARETMLAVKMTAVRMDVPNPFANVVSYAIHITQMISQYWDRQYQKAKYAIVLQNSPVEFLPLAYTKDGMHLKISDSDIDACIEHGFVATYQYFSSFVTSSVTSSALEPPPSNS